MIVKHLFLALPAFALLAACGGDAPAGNDSRAASGEVLEGTISDAMLPVDRVRSEPPLEDPEAFAKARSAADGDEGADTPDGDASAATDAETGEAEGAEPAAHARAVLAIDTLHAEFRDIDGLKRIAAASYADGFSGMLAIHPDQVPVINDAFTPGAEEIARARAIVNAFSANPGAGALQLDGRMIDQPHLDQARKLLERLR